MRCSTPFLSASEAARQLGVSTKALRLYEQRGLVAPARTVAGYRTYGPEEMNRAAEIVALRALGLSLAQVAQVLKGDPQSLEPALAAHEATLEAEIRQLVETIAKIRGTPVLVLPEVRRLRTESWHACSIPPQNSPLPLISRGRGVANDSNFATSGR